MNAATRSGLILGATSIYLASLIAFAPPGLCPCWLLSDVQHLHPHPDGHPERPHSHGYLFELFMSGTPAVAEPTFLPAATLILALLLAARWRVLADLALRFQPWRSPPQAPPPR